MFQLKKTLSILLFASCIMTAGCQNEAASKKDSPPKQEQKNTNTEKQSNEASKNSGNEKPSHPNEANGPLMVKESQQQLGNESFTNMTLDQIDAGSMSITEVGKSLLVHFTAVTKEENGDNVRKVYQSIYSKGKWQEKDKVAIPKELCEKPDISNAKKNSVSYKCSPDSKETTNLFFNEKGEISYKETGADDKSGFNREVFVFKSHAVKTDKGLMILKETGENAGTLYNMNDGKEVEKIETPGLSISNINFINTTKKEIIASSELYDYTKKDFVWGTDGQKLKLNLKGSVIGSDKTKKYYSYDRTQREKIEGGLKSKFEVMQTKLGASDAPAFIEFTGYFNDSDNEMLMNLAGDEIHFYGYYLFKNKPSIFMQSIAVQ